MPAARLAALLTMLALTVTDRFDRLRSSRDRGSETVDKVLWIALTVVIVLAVYAVFRTKILAKINGVSL
ncbi:hypothetical protein Val02_62540 [Virgisporangium aliadipatigenens]|uniref:Uncharacterized protein n=1 Tax=Virgisporangium aliadipatigenens TaxID=741659 RepID=A0A8J3YS24_9ACTN|nr:hypothetical protein [Virgisporangium aliadipatigenens]GIJ49368.1 hypothetical protein Val02_62540 [Virgisporangium aliadipatigenens]